MTFLLPDKIAKGASLRGDEYAWAISAFPEALAEAKAMGFACISGQFQFRLPDSICEMYWLDADATDQRDGELWADFSNRSCTEVLNKFQQLLSKTDFAKEAANWNLSATALETLVFVAYFESESTFAEISATRLK